MNTTNTVSNSDGRPVRPPNNTISNDQRVRSATGQFSTTAQGRAEDRKQRSLTNYDTIRTLALRGELEAFVANAALDFETDTDKFDRTIEIEGAEWLRRGGAL